MITRGGTIRSAALLVALVLMAACGDDADSSSDESPTTTAASTSTSVLDRVELEARGERVTMVCSGEGTTPVVLVAGGNDPPEIWDQLVEAMGADARTCRFGVVAGPDEAVPSKRAEQISAAMDELQLESAVMVGHSIAGQTLRQLGATDPDLVAGAVLVDPTPASIVPLAAGELTAGGWDAEATLVEAQRDLTWPEVPIVVLSRDPAKQTLGTPEVERIWADGQAEFTRLAPGATQEPVAGSGHYVHVDAPDRVAEAVRSMLDRAE